MGNVLPDFGYWLGIGEEVVVQEGGSMIQHHVRLSSLGASAGAAEEEKEVEGSKSRLQVSIVGLERAGKSLILDEIVCSFDGVLEGRPNFLKLPSREGLILPCVWKYVITGVQFLVAYYYEKTKEAANQDLAFNSALRHLAQDPQKLASDHAKAIEHANLAKGRTLESKTLDALKVLEMHHFFSHAIKRFPLVFTESTMINIEYIFRDHPSRFFEKQYSISRNPDDWRLLHLPSEEGAKIRTGEFRILADADLVDEFCIQDFPRTNLPQNGISSTSPLVLFVVPLVLVGFEHQRSQQIFESSLRLFAELIQRSAPTCASKRTIIIVFNQFDEFNRRSHLLLGSDPSISEEELDSKRAAQDGIVSSLFIRYQQIMDESGKGEGIRLCAVTNNALHPGNIIHSILLTLDQIPPNGSQMLKSIGTNKTVWTPRTNKYYPRPLQVAAKTVALCVAKRIPNDILPNILGYAMNIDDWLTTLKIVPEKSLNSASLTVDIP